MTNKSKVIEVFNHNVKGMVLNHKLAKAISDCGWGTLVNFLDYKLEPQQPKMNLSVREWTCINSSCNAHHDRDEAASRNIRAEGIRMLQVDGTATSASGGSVRVRFV